MADERMRLGETRLPDPEDSPPSSPPSQSALVVAGHWPNVYLSAGFGALSTAAYVLWLLHSGTRRRDCPARRRHCSPTPHPTTESGNESATPSSPPAPSNSPGRAHTDPGHRYLAPARALRVAAHAARQSAPTPRSGRPAIAAAVAQVVAADQTTDPLMARLAIHTLDLDRLATELEHPRQLHRLGLPASGPTRSNPPSPSPRRPRRPALLTLPETKPTPPYRTGRRGCAVRHSPTMTRSHAPTCLARSDVSDQLRDDGDVDDATGEGVDRADDLTTPATRRPGQAT